MLRTSHTLTILQLVAALFFAAAMHSSALACNASFRGLFVSVPCLEIAGDARPFRGSLTHAGGNNFVASTVLQTTLENPSISGLAIISTPSFYTAVVSGHHAACGGSVVLKPTITQVGNNVDIQVKMRVGVVPPDACANVLLAALPFAEGVPFLAVGDVRALTYSVNGVPITPGF